MVEIPAVTEGEEGENDKKDVIDAVVKNVLWQMTTGKPTKSLSQIQGHVWREAYKTGKIQGEWVSLSAVACSLLHTISLA